MGTQGQILLKVRDLCVRYGGGPHAALAVSRVSLTINSSEIVSLLGESGCGKSTLARAILGLLPTATCVEGSIRFRGQELTSASQHELQYIRGSQVALIAQDPAQALNPVLTIGVQVAELLRCHKSLSRSQRTMQVLEVLESVGFKEPRAISRRYAHQLSGGERQRAAIAQAIACRPSLLIADEATSKLDPRLKLELLELFEVLRAHHGMALMLITHEPAVAAGYAQRLSVMYAGEIVEAGPTVSILRHPMHPYTQALVELAHERCATRKPGRFATIAGESQTVKNANCCFFEARCGQRMPGCSTRHPLVTPRDGHEVVCLKYE